MAKAKTSESSCPLTRLPAELLVEILKGLRWKDILNARKTCKKLSEASRSWAVWEHQCTALGKPIPVRLERHASLYTSQELENLMLRWRKSQIGWKTGRHELRPLNLNSEVCAMYHLVKGGRWLLSVTKNASIIYYDLDAENITGRILIADQVYQPEESRSPHIMISVDNHEDITPLKFNMALSHYRFHVAQRRDEQLLWIWRVSLVPDASQRGVGLSAKCLAFFPNHPSIPYFSSLSLLGPYLSFGTKDLVNLCRYGLVVEWEEARNDPLNYRGRIIHPLHRARELRLIPNNRLLSTSSNNIQLHNYLSVEASTNLNTLDAGHADLIWRLQIEDELRDWPFISEPIIASGTTTLIVLTKHTVHALIVHNDSAPPVLVKLLDSSASFTFHSTLGCPQSFAFIDQSKICLLHYSLSDELEVEWEEKTTPKCGLRSFILDDIPIQPSCAGTHAEFDEGSGRLVSISRSFSHGVLVEFSLPSTTRRLLPTEISS